jgi:hypothetical protein
VSLSPTIQHLRSFPRNPEPRTKGNPTAKLTRALAEKFCNIISKSDDSVFKIIEDNPDFPSFNRLYHYQQRVPWFAQMWKDARIKQTHFLAHKCIELAKSAEPKTAHVVRIKFDIYRWFCAKFNPEIFAEKPASAPTQTVNVGVSISPERLSEIRTKLEPSRTAFLSAKSDSATRSESANSHAHVNH